MSARIARLGQERASSLEREYRTQSEVLRALGALFASSEVVDRKEFATFVAPFLHEHKGIQALEWVPRVSGAQRAAYEEAARRDGLDGFHFTERGDGGRMVPAVPRDEYFPVYYVEPHKGNERVLGFDNLSMNSPRLEALYTARDSGEIMATARITLIQDKEKQAGIIAFLPTYRNDAPADSIESRRENLTGFVVAVFRVPDLLKEALGTSGSYPVDCHLFDVSAPPAERFLACYPPYVPEAIDSSPEKLATGTALSYEKTLNVSGRQWSMVFTPSDGFFYGKSAWLGRIVFVSGLVITFLLSAYLWRMLRDLERTRAWAAQQASARHALEEEMDKRRAAEDALLAVSSRYEATLAAVPDILIEVNPQGACTWANPAGNDFFGADVLGKEVSTYISGEGETYGRLQSLLAGEKEVACVELRQRRANGEPRLLSWRCHVLRDSDGGVTGAVCSARDITNRRQTEDGLRESESKLRNTNRALVTISECNQALVRACDETELIQGICQSVVRSGGYRLAWVGYAQHDEKRSVLPVAWAGENSEDIRKANVSWAPGERGNGSVGTCIREQRPVFVQNLEISPGFTPWLPWARQNGYASAISLPLIADGKPFGSLSIYAERVNAFDKDEVGLLSQLANDLAYGITALRTRAELAQAMETTAMLARFASENLNPVMRITSDGILLYANNASGPVLSSWQCEVGDSLPEEWRAHVMRCIGLGVGTEMEAQCGERVYSFVLAPIPAAGYVNAYGTDITRRKRAEEALLASESRFRVMFESAGIGMALVDMQGRVVKSNHALHRMLGYDEAELAAISFRQITHPEYVELDWGLYAEMVEGKREQYQIEKKYFRKDGQVVWGRLTASLIQSPAGESQYAIGMVEDITGRKRAEEERARLAMAVESTAEAVVITDTAGEIEYVNRAFERITGYTREEAVGQNARLLKSGKQDDGFYKNMWETIGRGDVWTGRITNRRKDGELYEEEATISPVRNAEGSIVNYVAIKRDVTRELELEQQLRQSQKLEAVGTLAGGIAHDFNNILQSVLGFAEVAKADAADGEAVRLCLDEITVAGLRARDLVAQILAFSRQSGYKSHPLKLQHILKEIRGLLRGSIPSTIEIRCHIENECGPVLADPTRIHQIVMNLCTNAYHAMVDTGGELSLYLHEVSIGEEQELLHPDLRPGAYARLTVVDTGCGMEPSVMERIFDPYFTTKTRAQGSGLGLSVVMGIVKELGGAISVASAPGNGSRFEVLLPICLCLPEELDQERPVELKRTTAHNGTERVLLVDDEESILRALQSFLSSAGYDVKTCANGLEALSLFCAAPDRYDIVVTDQTMPHLTGMQLAKEIRRLRPDLPVVLCTGYSEAVDEATAKEHGLRGFVTKPIMPRALAQAIRTALNGVSESVA